MLDKPKMRTHHYHDRAKELDQLVALINQIKKEPTTEEQAATDAHNLICGDSHDISLSMLSLAAVRLAGTHRALAALKIKLEVAQLLSDRLHQEMMEVCTGSPADCDKAYRLTADALIRKGALLEAWMLFASGGVADINPRTE